EGPAESGMMGVMHERPEDSAPAPQPAPKSSYELPNRKNTSLRNILWALGLTMAIVVVVGISFFGAGSITEQETPESSRVDVAARAEAAAGFSIAVPEPGDTWQERSARFYDGQEPRWQIDYTSPQGQLVVLVQGRSSARRCCRPPFREPWSSRNSRSMGSTARCSAAAVTARAFTRSPVTARGGASSLAARESSRSWKCSPRQRSNP